MKWILLLGFAHTVSEVPTFTPYKLHGEVQKFSSQAECRQESQVVHAAVEKIEGAPVQMSVKCEREGLVDPKLLG
ncbi:hypothetical protein [Chromobacterium haemolyticum]|uniref:hypothetical protein n=1 Tax=Chromobacterium haemolyticum TaxID=394935 RepID=UPI00244CD966|nr:hypothetical protein [Chromobacterium haemolyticum]MDH0342075.1 hypothetical protein [Chromobacterium haemolyticum]